MRVARFEIEGLRATPKHFGVFEPFNAASSEGGEVCYKKAVCECCDFTACLVGARRAKKKIKRKNSLGASSLKLQGRRRAVTEFNALSIQLGADALILGREMAWQASGKRLASAWQAGGKRPVFLASARFTILGEATTYAFFYVSGFGNPAQAPLVQYEKTEM